MKVKPIQKTVKANALTDPNPSFVSMVRAGANQQPFKAVRFDAAVPAEQGATPMKIKHKALAGVTPIAPSGYGVMQFEFDPSKFTDEAAVKAWLDAGGYSEYTVKSSEKAFIVEDSTARFEAGSVRKIDGAVEGVAVYVGKLADPTSGSEPAVEPAVEPTAPVEPIDVTKVEGYVPPVEHPNTAEQEPGANGGLTPVVTEVEKPGHTVTTAKCEEGVQPAATVPSPPARQRAAMEAAPAAAPVEVPAVLAALATAPVAPVTPAATDNEAVAAMKAILAVIPADRKKDIYSAYDLGFIVTQLAWIVNDAEWNGLTDDTVSAIRMGAQALLAAFLSASQEAASSLLQAFLTPEQQDAIADAAAAAAQAIAPLPGIDPATGDLTAPPGAGKSIDASIIARAVAEAIAPLAAQVAGMNDRVTAAESEATQARERAVKAEQQLAERVEADNNVSQTRKGAEEPPAPESTVAKPRERSDASTNLLAAMGSRHARRSRRA